MKRLTLISARKSAGYTQSSLGAKIGKAAATIRCYESGKRTPDDLTKLMIAKTLKRTVSELFFSELANKLED